MKITEVPTTELQRITIATERAVGPDAPEVRAMRRELERRDSLHLSGVAKPEAEQGGANAR
jgi:hypothetical protein